MRMEQGLVYLGPACPALKSLGLGLWKSSFLGVGIMRGASASQQQQDHNGMGPLFVSGVPD